MARRWRVTTREKLAGILVVIYAYAKHSSFRVALHYARHPLQWRALARIPKEGLLSVSRRYALIPYGFSRPSRWTTDAPTCPLAKRDALPVNIIDMLTQQDVFGRRIGTSLFIESGTTEEREPRKRAYLAGLTSEAVDEYAFHMRRLSGSVVPTCDAALDLSCRLTFLIHFGREPSSREFEAIRRVADGITHSLNCPFHPDLSTSKCVLRAAVERTTGGMTKRWMMAGMTKDDAYVELAHNVFGMTLQWAYLIRRMSLKEMPIVTLEDAARTVLEDPPAAVAASRVDDAIVIHDLRERCKRASVPVSFRRATRREHVVHDDQPIASEDDDHYVPFGYGARRCPGEWLTYTMLRTLRVRGGVASSSPIRLGINECW